CRKFLPGRSGSTEGKGAHICRDFGRQYFAAGGAFKRIAADIGKPGQPVRTELRPDAPGKIVEAGHAEHGCEDEREARRSHSSIEAGRERGRTFDSMDNGE